MIKLPKSWKHWCKKHGLTPAMYNGHAKRGIFAWFYLKGHNRIWWIDPDCMFNSILGKDLDNDNMTGDDTKRIVIPTTEKEFANFVKSLRKNNE